MTAITYEHQVAWLRHRITSAKTWAYLLDDQQSWDDADEVERALDAAPNTEAAAKTSITLTMGLASHDRIRLSR